MRYAFFIEINNCWFNVFHDENFDFIILFLLSINSNASVTPICKKWFEVRKIKANGEKCYFECAKIPHDFGTFMCPAECEELCGFPFDNPQPKGLEQIAYISGLTLTEMALIAESAEDALIVYRMKNRAEKISVKIMDENLPNDESDAIRHFSWAILLAYSLGQDRAFEFLNAHEDGQFANPDRAMDLSNNKEGIQTFVKLKKSGIHAISDEIIEKEARKALKEKRLVVLKPKKGLKW